MGLDTYHQQHPRGDRTHQGGSVEGCADCGSTGQVPQETISAPELPTTLYRIEVVRYAETDDFPDLTRRIYYQENEQAAIEELEDALESGAGLQSIHKLALLKVDGQPRWYWDRLDYRPPGPGRFVAPKRP